LARLSAHLGYAVSAEEIAARLARIARDPAAAVFVAENSGGMVGWIQLLEQHVLELGSRVEVAALVVDESVRRAGVGRRLMDYAEQWGRARGCEFVNVRSNVKRAVAHAFYQGLGYRHYKSQKAFRKDIAKLG
jgi:GNAT superfamily N-acetyltransferase